MEPGSLGTLPHLENGDCLTRDEFERRYTAMSGDLKAELIDGVVYMSSPAKTQHGRYVCLLATWLGTYEASTPGVESLSDATLRLDETSEPQPDVMLCRPQTLGGISLVDGDDYATGPVELAVEVAVSSASYDLHQKKEVYRRCGVIEYLVYVVRKNELRWFHLDQTRYVLLPMDDDGLIRSRVFPGLWLDPNALAERSASGLLKALDLGLASPEHAEYVKALGG